MADLDGLLDVGFKARETVGVLSNVMSQFQEHKLVSRLTQIEAVKPSIEPMGPPVHAFRRSYALRSRNFVSR